MYESVSVYTCNIKKLLKFKEEYSSLIYEPGKPFMSYNHVTGIGVLSRMNYGNQSNMLSVQPGKGKNASAL